MKIVEKPNYQKAVASAQKLLKQYDIKEPVVPIFQIAEAEGITLSFTKMPKKLESVAGFFDDNKKIIFVNDDDSPNRQTFTIAHELGHYILKHKPDEYGVLPRIPNLSEKNPIEQEANCFAANLLVPSKMLKETMNKYSLTRLNTSLLAQIFGVSEEVMRIRLKWDGDN